MKAVEIVPGVHSVLRGFVGAYVVEDDDGLVLLDCGVPKSEEAIETALREMGRQAEEISHIFVTHHHSDHIGALAAMAERTGAQVHVHGTDAPVARGEERYEFPVWRGPVARIVGPLIARGNQPDVTGVPTLEELSGGEALPIAGGIRVLHTPGHTMGHTSYLFERSPRTLVVGDAATNLVRLRPTAGPLMQVSTVDPDAALQSFRMLAALDFEAAVFGHGRPIASGASERFKRTARHFRRTS